jgi:hypothetical protein
MISVPNFLHPFFGKKLKKIDLFWSILWLILGVLLSYLVDRNFYLNPLKAFVYVVLLSDVILGAYLNTTTSVISYYDQRGDYVIKFPFIHLYPFVMIWLFDIPFSLAFATYLSTTIVTLWILSLKRHKALYGWIAILIVSFIFGLVEQGHSLAYILLTFISVIKLVISFGTHHMLSCPVFIKRQ